MPRRLFEPGYYHVYNRGLDKMTLFKSSIDFQRFFELVLKYQKVDTFKNFKILSYCFLPNHFHFIVDTPAEEISLFMGCLQNAYAKYFNQKYSRRGGLFEGRFQAKCIRDEEYLSQCLNYVNFNALKHGIVSDIGEYPWTSYHQLSDEQKGKSYTDLILSELEY